jgi:hypothetical protein
MDHQRVDRAGGGVRFRKLRIAWSVLSGILCLLLIALWVISRSRYSGIEGHVGNQSFSVISSLGQMNIHLFTRKAVALLPWRFSDSEFGIDEVVMPEHWGFEIYPNRAGLSVYVSYWVLVLIAGIVFAAPWMPRRYSLRTLLIGMTVLAALLGVAIVALRGG